MFRKYEINPFQVSDRVSFRNIDKTITLEVKGDASAFVAGLKVAQAKLSELTEESSECEKFNCARFFAKVIFGEEQADQLVDFYNNADTVITVCGMYFQKRLANKITKAQKR